MFARIALAAGAVACTLSSVASAEITPLLLRQGTPITVRNCFEINTKTAKAGERFEFEVTAPVMVGGTVVIPPGARGVGQVTWAERNGHVGKSGKLGARLLYIDYKGHHVDLDGQVDERGKGGTVEMVAAVVAVGVTGLLVHGTSARLKAEAPMTAYVRWDTPMMPAGTFATAALQAVVPAIPQQRAAAAAPTALPAPGFSAAPVAEGAISM